MDTVSEFHVEALQAIASEGLAQGPYMAARAGFKTTTLRTKGDESTNEPPCLYLCNKHEAFHSSSLVSRSVLETYILYTVY